jgi:hypothetical protein
MDRGGGVAIGIVAYSSGVIRPAMTSASRTTRPSLWPPFGGLVVWHGNNELKFFAGDRRLFGEDAPLKARMMATIGRGADRGKQQKKASPLSPVVSPLETENPRADGA